MKPKDYEKWKATREKGRFRYILFNGVLLFGFPMGVGAALGSTLVEGLFTTKILISVAIWFIVGLFYGVSTWSINESLFKKCSSASTDT